MYRWRRAGMVCSVVLIWGVLLGQTETTAPAQPSAPTPTGSSGGTVRGVVRNAENQEPIPGARVSILGTNLNAETRADGTFEIIGSPSGKQTLQVLAEGLASYRGEVEVPPGSEVQTSVNLAIPRRRVLTIRGQARAGTGLEMARERVSAVTGVAQIGREQLSAGTKGSAAEALTQLPGVSTVDSKFVYVRGLGDRYSQTLLNGASIPSPEPDKRAIPLDLFPTNLLEAVVISKTYSPDVPGEFAGGSVLLRTVGVPDAPFFTFGVDFKYKDKTSLRDFKTYDGGKYDIFGIDDGTRALPDAVPADRVEQASVGGAGLTDEQLQEIARSFNNTWAVETITAPLDHKVSMSFGHLVGQKGDRSFGVVGAVNWANRYQNILNEKRRIVVNTGTIDNPNPEVFSDFRLDSSTFEAELSGLLNLTFEINPAQKVGLRTLYTRNANDEVRLQTGSDGQQAFPIDLTRLRYVQRSLFNVQPYGEHLLVGDTFLEWRGGYALSQRDEPDNRQVRYLLDPARNDFSWQPSAGSGRRDFYLLDENIYDAAFDYSIPFNPLGVPDKNPDPDRPDRNVPEQRIKIGPAFVYRDRDFDSRRMLFEPTGGSTPVDDSGFPIDFFDPPQEIFERKNLNPNGIVISEQTRATDSYEATQELLAGYGYVDFRIIEALRLQTGVRYESSVQKVVTGSLTNPGEEVETELDTGDFLPALNIIWEFWQAKNMQLRVGGSQTVSRPEFRELAPFEYTDVQGGYTSVGNPNLQRAKILNADIAWEWFVTPSELLSVGFFYKKFQDPIEAVNVPAGSSLITTWENADSADLIGLEFEARKSLAIVDALKALKDLSVVTNFSWMDSEVRVAEGSGAGLGNLQTNKKRSLQGQPDYLFNIGLLYDSKDTGWTVSVLANTFGERISAVGSSGIDDEKEQPRWALDVSIIKRIGNGALKITGENLLNDKYEYKQGDITTREYRKGFAIGVGYSYSF